MKSRCALDEVTSQVCVRARYHMQTFAALEEETEIISSRPFAIRQNGDLPDILA